MGRVRSALLALLAACCLTACGVSIDSPAPSEAEVLSYVKLQCPSEDFEVVGSEEVREVPQKVVYTLRSTERDLTFTATSEITEPTNGILPSGPKTRVSCDYASTVRNLYRDAVVEELSQRVDAQAEDGVVFTPGWPELYVRDYAQLEEALALLGEADALYEPELAYNSVAWIRENASTSVAIRWFDGTLSSEDGMPTGWQQLGDVELCGELDAEAALEGLAGAYAQLVADGTAPADPTLPGRFLKGLHRSCIDRMTVRGKEVPFGFDAESIDDFTNPYQVFHWREDKGVVAHWSEDEGCYLVRVNLNGTSGELYADAEERKKELMQQNEMQGLMFKMENDPRITKVGAFIRKTSIDELPQFWNVLRGDMSLVGTRPPTLDEYQQYQYYQKRRISFRPGITGLWQISGRSDIKDFDEGRYYSWEEVHSCMEKKYPFLCK